MDSVEFRSLYFASVFDERRIIPLEKMLFNGIFQGGLYISEHLYQS